MLASERIGEVSTPNNSARQRILGRVAARVSVRIEKWSYIIEQGHLAASVGFDIGGILFFICG